MHTTYTRHEMPAFMQIQFAFTGAVRDPQNGTLPAGVTARRMAVYQELIFNNIDESLRSAFPVLREISSERRWRGLIRDFLIEHRARTPLFPELPREFLRYLEQVRTPRDDDFPFMVELAHYEWAELALGISEEAISDAGISRKVLPLDGIPQLSPLIWLCQYRYPVHRIAPGFMPKKPGAEPTYLLIYRDRNDEVGFMELNRVTAGLLQRLQQNSDKSAETVLLELARELHHPNPATVIHGGEVILQEFLARDIILGTRQRGETP